MLILTEKPSVAKAFADALGVTRKENYYENGEHCVVSALGHLLENYSPEDYDPSLKKWDIESLPIIPDQVKFKAIEKTKAQLAAVKSCFARHKNDPFLLATDAEREGEVIGAELLDYVGFANYANARRFWVSEALTPEVIKKGVESAKPLAEYKPYRDQGFARQFADWLIGMNLTRLITLKTDKLLHFGRVQTAVLGAVYEREKAIQNFTSQKYFEIRAVMNRNNFNEPDVFAPFSVKLFNPDNEEFPTRFSSAAVVKKIEEMEKIKKSVKTGTLVKINKEKKTLPPPQLFNLTALQKEAHKQYGYSPEQTLEIAQALYEKHKILSYPRTPSRVMGDDNVELVKNIYEILKKEYSNAGTEHEENIKGSDISLINASNKRIFNSAELQDHHALIPLGILPLDISDQERFVYDLVYERFFTVLKPPYVYNSVLIDVDISGHKFIGKGIEVINSGWKYGSEGVDDDRIDDGKDPEKDYSNLEENKEYPVISIDAQEKQTEPKKHYTFASLLQLMENPRGDDGKHLTGLGTPATRGSILQKLVDRKYVSLKGKNILISDDGNFLIENVLKNDDLAAFISVPETTRWEEQLHDDTAAFIEGIKCFVRGAVKNTGMEAYRREKKSLGKCPLCGGDVYEGQKSYYCGNYKAENLCKFVIWKNISQAAVTHADVQALLSGKLTKVKKCVSGKTGKEFNAKFELAAGKIEFRFEDKK
ncbi:DNA topoisomerase III [Treponema sp. R8-4-B8]